MRLGRPIATNTRHVPRWALALALALVALVLLAARTRRSTPPLATTGSPVPAEPEPPAGDEGDTGGTEAPDRRTRQELYAEAQRLGIPGRSKMNKDELIRAVADWTG